jgi:hypothetical protein
MKEFYNVLFLAQRFEFDCVVLRQAIEATYVAASDHTTTPALTPLCCNDRVLSAVLEIIEP